MPEYGTPAAVAAPTSYYTRLYVEASLEDGRTVLLPAQSSLSLAASNIVSSLPQASRIYAPVATGRYAAPQLPRKESVDVTSLSVGSYSRLKALTNSSLMNSSIASPAIETPDSTAMVHTVASLAGKFCMVGCGRLGQRLLTDDRCGHAVCVACLMENPKFCPVCYKLRPPLQQQQEAPPKEQPPPPPPPPPEPPAQPIPPPPPPPPAEEEVDVVLGGEGITTSSSTPPSAPSDSLTCKLCFKICKRPGDLIRHEKMCHGRRHGEHECDVCKKTFSRKFDLIRHGHTHKPAKLYPCNQCDRKFNRQENLRRHLTAHSEDKPFVCAYCSKPFKQQENLKRHVAVSHTGNFQTYKCGECDRDFTRLASLRRHQRIHSGVWAHICNACDPPRGFAEPGQLEKHKLVHQGISPYVCETCDKGFNNRKSFHTHKRIHLGIKPYACNVCGKAFVSWNGVKRHRLTHIKPRPPRIPRRSIWCKKPSDPTKPKLPMGAYFLWFMDARERIKKSNPNITMPDLAKAGGRLWKTVNQEERLYYELKAREKRYEYQEAIVAYRGKRRKLGGRYTVTINPSYNTFPAEKGEENQAAREEEPGEEEEEEESHGGDATVVVPTLTQSGGAELTPSLTQIDILGTAGRSAGIVPPGDQHSPAPVTFTESLATPPSFTYQFSRGSTGSGGAFGGGGSGAGGAFDGYTTRLDDGEPFEESAFTFT